MITIDLNRRIGLPICIKGNALLLGEDVAADEVKMRTLGDLQGLLLNPVMEVYNRFLYYMYRDIHLRADRKEIEKRKLRYDVTIIPPGKLGREYVKTAGHYHPLIPGKRETYPEIYEVITGKAHYLLQEKSDMRSDEVKRVIVITAESGDKVLIPPGYGHITINPSGEQLVMANWVAAEFKSVYGSIERKHGGAYFEVEEGGQSCWVPNDNYRDLPPLEQVKARDSSEFIFSYAQPLYMALYEPPELLGVLTDPIDILVGMGEKHVFNQIRH